MPLSAEKKRLFVGRHPVLAFFGPIFCTWTGYLSLLVLGGGHCRTTTATRLRRRPRAHDTGEGHKNGNAVAFTCGLLRLLAVKECPKIQGDHVGTSTEGAPHALTRTVASSVLAAQIEMNAVPFFCWFGWAPVMHVSETLGAQAKRAGNGAVGKNKSFSPRRPPCTSLSLRRKCLIRFPAR